MSAAKAALSALCLIWISETTAILTTGACGGETKRAESDPKDSEAYREWCAKFTCEDQEGAQCGCPLVKPEVDEQNDQRDRLKRQDDEQSVDDALTEAHLCLHIPCL